MPDIIYYRIGERSVSMRAEIRLNKKAYAAYANQARAVYKIAAGMAYVYDKDELAEHAEAIGLAGMAPADIERRIADTVIDYGLDWDDIREKCVYGNGAQSVPDDALDDMLDAVKAYASECAELAGWDGLTSGMAKYISGEQADTLYDRSIG